MLFSSEKTSATVIKLGVSVLVEDAAGAVLLELRRDCGLWGCVGGRVEPGESVSAAAIRETQEETGLEVALTGLQGIYSEPQDRIVTYDDNGDERHLVDIIFTGRIVGGGWRAAREPAPRVLPERSVAATRNYHSAQPGNHGRLRERDYGSGSLSAEALW